MKVFSQKDPAWGDLKLGESDYTMRGEGCLTVAITQAAFMAGYITDPGVTCKSFSEAGVYTPKTYSAGPGLVLWYSVKNIFPAFNVEPGLNRKYQFVQVLVNGRVAHWILRVDGTYYDPIDGSTFSELPAKYKVTGRAFSANISLVTPVDPTPETPPPALEPTPTPTPAPEAPRFPRNVEVTHRLGLKVRRAPDHNSEEVVEKRLTYGSIVSVCEEVIGSDPYGDGKNVWLLTTVSRDQGTPRYIWAGATNY